MPSSEAKATISQKDFVQSAWNKIRSHLENEKVRIYGEIGHYPPPIAACDQQFTHLLEEQTRILGELARLDAAEQESLTADDPVRVIEAFIRLSAYVDLEEGIIYQIKE